MMKPMRTAVRHIWSINFTLSAFASNCVSDNHCNMHIAYVHMPLYLYPNKNGALY